MKLILLEAEFDTDDDALLIYKGHKYCYHAPNLFIRQYVTTREEACDILKSIEVPKGYKASELLRELIDKAINGENRVICNGNQEVEIAIIEVDNENTVPEMPEKLYAYQENWPGSGCYETTKLKLNDHLTEYVRADLCAGVWVPVTERLPKDRHDVLVRYKYPGGEVAVDYCWYSYDGMKEGWHDKHDNFVGGLYEVTHWLDLKLPGEVEG